jgi:hypothetical protein
MLWVMKLSRVVVMAVGFLACLQGAICADGFKLSLAVDAGAPDLALRVSVQNISETPLDVVIGHQVGKDVIYDLRFFATSPDGKEREVYDYRSFTPIAGLVLPVVVRIASGETKEYTFLAKKIIAIERAGDITLDTLLAQGYSLRVSLEVVDSHQLGSGITERSWIGKVVSRSLCPQAHSNRPLDTDCEVPGVLNH